MRSYFIVVDGAKKGPFPRDKVVRAYKAGHVPQNAEIIDATTGSLVLHDDLMSVTDPKVHEGAGQRALDYGRTGGGRNSGPERFKNAPTYISTGAVIGLFVLYHFIFIAPLQKKVDALVKWADQPFVVQR